MVVLCLKDNITHGSKGRYETLTAKKDNSYTFMNVIMLDRYPI